MMVCLAALGCGQGVVTGPKPVTIQLAGSDGELELNGSPIDPGYRARYDNPRNLTSMVAVVDPHGRLQLSCARDSASAPCSDVPLYVYVKLGASPVVQVYDSYKVKVAEIEYWSTACPAPPSQSNTGTNHSYLGTGETVDTSESCNPTGGGGSGEFPDGGECVPQLEDAKDRFCELVNQNLAKYGIQHVYDCADLPNSEDVWEEPPNDIDPPEQFEDVGCRGEITEPAQQHLLEEYQSVTNTCIGALEHYSSIWREVARDQMRSWGWCGNSPLALDLAGNGLALTSVADGVTFDLLQSGTPARTAWLAGADDAWLVWDRNGNGMVDGGAELFGEASDARIFTDGFVALAELDGNRDGRIDASDPLASRLMLWIDSDRNGRSDPGELQPLRTAGIVALELSARRITGPEAWDRFGNHIPLVSRFVRADGSAGLIADVFLQVERAKPTTLAEVLFRRVAR
jgi:hypothetical protein